MVHNHKHMAPNSLKDGYTCPMHPEVIKEASGSCPICGMDLIPMEPDETEEQKVYKDLLKKMKIATIFTIPVFFIAMIEMNEGNPLLKIMDASRWNWVQLLLTLPVVFYACWMFSYVHSNLLLHGI